MPKRHRAPSTTATAVEPVVAPTAGMGMGNQAMIAQMQAANRVPLPHEVPDSLLLSVMEAPKTPEKAERSEVPYSDLPAALRSVADDSFGDPSRWYHGLSKTERADTVDVYNRLVGAGLWGHVKSLRGVKKGEADAFGMGVQGKTPSIELEVYDEVAFRKAVAASGRFGKDGPIMGLAHRGQSSYREASSEDGTSNEDGMHISVGPGTNIDAHIDRISPVGEPDAKGRSRPIGGRMLGHGTRELVPDIVRGVFGIPGFTPLQTSGEVAANDPSAPNLADAYDTPLMGALRFELPARSKAPKQLPSAPRTTRGTALDPGASTGVDAAVAGMSGNLVPPGAKDAGSYADTTTAAHEMARRMVKATAAGDGLISFNPGALYGTLNAADRQRMLDATRDIARAVRASLGDRADGILGVRVTVGDRTEVIPLD
jgi:hypothetical protein